MLEAEQEVLSTQDDNRWIVRILSTQMLAPFIPRCAKRQLRVCLFRSMSWFVAMEKQRGRGGLCYPGEGCGYDLTDSAIWVWKKLKHVAEWLHIVNFVPLAQSWEGSVTDSACCFRWGVRFYQLWLTGVKRPGKSERCCCCCCCDKAERWGWQGGKEELWHQSKVTLQGRSWRMEPGSLGRRSCILSAHTRQEKIVEK